MTHSFRPFCILMESNYTNYFNEFEKEFELLKSSSNDILVVSVKIIEVIENKLKLIYKWLKKYVFENLQEEIYFFKELKPRLVSKLIYYKSVLDIEKALPPSKKSKIKNYEKVLNEVNKNIIKNKSFYEYYRSRSSHKDEDYFVRRPYKNLLRDDCALINYDSKLSTSHDYVLASIIANDMLTVYLERKLEELSGKFTLNNTLLNTNLNWTASKVDLVELIYALQQSGAINGGNIDVKELAIGFGKMLNIDIEDNLYRAYLDIKSRKTVQTKFLNMITENLNKKISEEEL